MARIRAGIGIDLGSSAVRVGIYDLEDDSELGNVREQVPYYYHRESPLWEYTQRTDEIVAAIESCFIKLKIEQYDIKSCGVSATCSLAIFIKDKDYLLPFSGLEGNEEQNVVFWMDSTARKECELLNDSCSQNFKDIMGGGFIPEMAIPKILRLSNYLKTANRLNDKPIVVMDLHRYIAYQIAKQYGWDFQKLANFPNANGAGHDGELSGWSSNFYTDYLKLPSQLIIGPEPGVNKNSENSPVKAASCIDCYSSWLSLCSSNSMRSLFIVGGTSTCFLLATRRQDSIPGVWGPFTNILHEGNEFNLYEGGQSCTGRLIEHLLETHPASSSVPKQNWASLLEKIDHQIADIEETSGSSIHMKTKHMFFYGDLQGNRTPYADPAMSGSFIGETTDVSFTNLIYKYVCILEFLAFQIKYMVSVFNNNDKEVKIDELRICGSQARNRRLLTLISFINNNIPIRLPTADADLSGVLGAYLLGKCASSDKPLIELIQQKVDSRNIDDFTTDARVDPSLSKLLDTKYEIHLDMAEQQIRYRQAVDRSLLVSTK